MYRGFVGLNCLLSDGMTLYNMYKGFVSLNCLLSDGYVVYYGQGICEFDIYLHCVVTPVYFSYETHTQLSCN